MSAGDYHHCPICGRKALYDGSDETPDVEVLHRECFKLIIAERDRFRGQRDDALTTIRALVGHPAPDPLVALTMTPDAGWAFRAALIYAANRIPREARKAHGELPHEEWLRWGAGRLDAALTAAEAKLRAAAEPSGTEASRGD